jgi:hypothetical protein
MERKRGEGRSEGMDLGPWTYGALDEGPQPKHGENEEPQRHVVARLRVPYHAGGHRGHGIEQDSDAVQRCMRRGATDSPPRPGSPPGAHGDFTILADFSSCMYESTNKRQILKKHLML